MSQLAVPLPGRSDGIKVRAAESTRMNGQLLVAAWAQNRQLELIGVEPKLPSILAAVAQQRPHVVRDQLGNGRFWHPELRFGRAGFCRR